MDNLITITEIQAIRQLNSNYSTQKLNAYIQEAQNMALKDLLTPSLWYDFSQNVTDLKYQDLVNGTSFVDGSGQTIQLTGLKTFLCYHVLVKITNEGNAFFQESGITGFKSENQNYVTKLQTEKIATAFLNTATKLGNEVIEFLNQNTDTYPLWSSTNQDSTNFFFDII